MLSFLSRFVSKGTIAAVGAVFSWAMGQWGYADLAATLTDPEFLQSLFNWIAMGLTLYAGVAQGIKPKAPAPVEGDRGITLEALQDIFEPDTRDPYPDFDWSPIHGWIRKDDPRLNGNAT